jgi:plastocyanin
MTRPERSLPRHVRTAALISGAVLMLGCGDGPAGPSDNEGPVRTTSVSVQDNRFSPSSNAVDPGATVTWSWGGSNPHNVTFDDASIADSPTQTDGNFQQTFPDDGEFTYFCTVHGRAVMSGRVVVGE